MLLPHHLSFISGSSSSTIVLLGARIAAPNRNMPASHCHVGHSSWVFSASTAHHDPNVTLIRAPAWGRLDPLGPTPPVLMSKLMSSINYYVMSDCTQSWLGHLNSPPHLEQVSSTRLQADCQPPTTPPLLRGGSPPIATCVHAAPSAGDIPPMHSEHLLLCHLPS